MRILLALAVLLAAAALAPSATAAQCPPICPGLVSVTPTLPSASCGDCVGVDVTVSTPEPAGCNDCGGIGAEASVQHDGDGTTASLLVCRGGFVVICPVDQTLSLPV
jgi:hypothetical protein